MKIMRVDGLTSFHEEIEGVVTEASHAPSIHDTQPWHWLVADRRLELFADPSRLLGAVDPDGRQLLISCGAALYYARIALRLRGFVPDVVVLPGGPGYGGLDRDLAGKEPLATIRINEARPPDAWERSLGTAVHLGHAGHAGRGPIQPTPDPTGVLAALQDAAATEDAWLATLDDTGTDDHLATNAPSARPGQVDGQDSIVVLGTAADRPIDRMAAGQALARVLLSATALSVAACPIGHAEDIDAIRVVLREILHSTGTVQMVIRLGLPAAGGVPAEPAPRRPLSEVLTISD
ncbi:hypothetical protein [Frankia sp. Cas4]|uniref:hypothetical protein n=2 Tax=Frankia TaxID=1854 RepID=UPI002AD25AEC|nr:hypothetical protein [Frankia sp. Cas4]